MDATNEPEKAQNTADSAQGRNADAPQIDSPSLVPEQDESAPIKDTAEPMMTSGTALVITAFDPRRERAQNDAEPTPEQKRWRLKNWRAAKFSSLAAALALALGIGAVAGATATLGLQRALIQDSNGDTGKLQESLVRLSSEFATFKASVEASGKTASTQVQRLAERLDRADRAQVEPNARLAKLADAVDKLEKRAQIASAAPATIPAVSPVAAPRAPTSVDVTGSVNTAASKDPAKDVARLPVVPGWVLHSVYGGTAIVQGRMGLVEIEVGDPLPGGGRVEAIRRENGRWVVITSRGLILTR
jgi:hypothetical protein